jgi:hypothetical protein
MIRSEFDGNVCVDDVCEALSEIAGTGADIAYRARIRSAYLVGECRSENFLFIGRGVEGGESAYVGIHDISSKVESGLAPW